MKLSILIFLCFLCPVLAAIGIYNGGGSSSSWSSESHEGGHGHGHGGRPRPPRPPVRPRPPPRPRPPREKTNCPADWMLFKRSQGNWCVKVTVGMGLNQFQAEQQCVALGAKLTGLQTDEERLRLAEAAKSLMFLNGFGQATVWLGCKRKASCSAGCPAKDTFDWTDGQTTGTDGFTWALGQPSGNFHPAWGREECCHQFVFSSGTTNPMWPGIFHGQLDDVWCPVQVIGSNNKMFACGKLAT